MVHRKTVSLEPALSITAQVVLGFVFGLPGLVLATPLAAACLVCAKMLYVENVLGEKAGTEREGDQEVCVRDAGE